MVIFFLEIRFFSHVRVQTAAPIVLHEGFFLLSVFIQPSDSLVCAFDSICMLQEIGLIFA